MDSLDLQIFFGELFQRCKNEQEVAIMYDKIIDNLEISKDERLETLGE